MLLGEWKESFAVEVVFAVGVVFVFLLVLAVGGLAFARASL